MTSWEHRKTHLQDCEVAELWGPWSECSATCGGGVRTASLISRNVTKPQDAWRYGKSCPVNTRRFEACAQEVPCPADCSTVDLNNRLPAVGGATKWKFEAEFGQCVFEYWQVLPSDPTPRVRFLGRTKEGADLATADGAAVYDAGEPSKRFVLQLENADVAQSDVAIGFRGCTLKLTGEAPSVAKVCVWGGDGFRPEAQTAVLDQDQLAALAALRAASPAGDLAKRASAKEGVGAGERGVTFEGSGTGPGFAVQVEMAPLRPDAPTFRNVSEAGDDLLVEVQLRDNGAKIDSAFKVSLRRQFLNQNNDACNFVPVQPCGSGLTPKEPCFSGTPAHAGPGVVLRNLVFASRCEVQLAVQNAAGWGDPMAAVTVLTRARSGVPLKDCAVNWWACSTPDPEGPQDHVPSAGDPQCSLTALPLPVCLKTWPLGPKTCNGRKYLHTCKPFMKAGKPTCAGELESVCVYKAPERFGDVAPPAKCEAAGCSKAFFFWNQEHCCCRSKEDTGEDSPNCACTTESCDKLGMVDAVNPGSCRH